MKYITEWDGNGLPPVGSRVEVLAEDFEGDWFVIEVVFVHNGEVIGIVQSDNEYLNDRLEKFSASYNRAEFRPIKSEADKKRDSILLAIEKAYKDCPHSEAVPQAIYEAIASGDIPGIKIE